MRREHLIVKTKLAPPKPPSRMLDRPRVRERIFLAKDYRLTVIHAGAGYGKSTALSELSRLNSPLVWYHLSEEDADPLTFLSHLLAGFRQTFPDLSNAANASLEAWEGGGGWETIVDILSNDLTDVTAEMIFLILDDTHALNRNKAVLSILNQLIARAPQNLHIILSTRSAIHLADWVNWKLTDKILEITQTELAFTPEEIGDLFSLRGNLSLTAHEISAMAKETHGWAIALQLIRQRLQTNPALSVGNMLKQLSVQNRDIFAYLAQNVLQQQTAAIQEFLLTTAILQQMTAQQCDCLRAASDSITILRQLQDDGLFVASLGDGTLRYHPLFHNFLLHRLAPATTQALHLRAAACYRQRKDDEGTVFHLLRAGAFEEAATILDVFGRDMVWVGRLDTLTQWMSLIPESVIINHPPLLIYRGDMARLHSRFESALGWYRQAETLSRKRNDIQGLGRALRGQARVYLDTVDPAPAEKLLEEALQLTEIDNDQAGRSRLLNLLAENMLNLGQLEQAEHFRAQAESSTAATPRPFELTARVLLRTGRLHEAYQRLSEQLTAEEKTPVNRPRGHRETLLLLSLAASFLGKQIDALNFAKRGTQRGKLLNVPFSTSVGYARQGHAHVLLKTSEGYRQAIGYYEKALEISETMLVPRLKPEPLWGLCQAYSFQGDIDLALVAARQAIEILEEAGDEWVASFVRATMGAGYVVIGQFDAALTWLNTAGNGFRECSDPYGECVVQLWRALSWFRLGDTDRLTHTTNQLLELVQTHKFDFLFTRKTFIGPPDLRQLVPILLHATQFGEHKQVAHRILDTLGLGQVEIHPGYQLRIRTLGQFSVSMNNRELPPQAWQRKKSRQLFQLFITYRDILINRDRILEMLFSDVSPDKARRDFKVALSTLTRVLEPNKARRAPSAFILRDDDAYGLRPYADIWIDADEFIREIELGDALHSTASADALSHYRRVISLYRDDYLPDTLYDDWSAERREHLLSLFLRTAERVARIFATQDEWEKVITTCQRLLAHDDCWEEAYRLTMTAYAKLGNRPQVLRTFRHCTKRLDIALSIAPSPETVAVFRKLTE